MRRIDWILLAIGLGSALAWSVVAGKDGFKGSNALIVARSIAITATIDGQVDNEPPPVGARVSSQDLLVRIHNARIDQGRLVEFESNVNYLQLEIANAEREAERLQEQLAHYREKAENHAEWLIEDLRLGSAERAEALEIAEKNSQLKTDQVQRAEQLYKLQHTASAMLETAQIEADIAASEVDMNRAMLRRNQLLKRSVEANGMFFENGDASYWERMVDELLLRQADNQARIASLGAQLTRAKRLADVERSRIGSSIEERHRAPFDGMVNATYVGHGTRVTSGTNLLQVLDCDNPIAIVPIPENRIGEFQVGLPVTVYPVDSDAELAGSITYISSGPLIGHDQTLLVQEDLTLGGVHAVINFMTRPEVSRPGEHCEPAHKAVVVIHTRSRFAGIADWMSRIL